MGVRRELCTGGADEALVTAAVDAAAAAVAREGSSVSVNDIDGILRLTFTNSEAVAAAVVSSGSATGADGIDDLLRRAFSSVESPKHVHTSTSPEASGESVQVVVAVGRGAGGVSSSSGRAFSSQGGASAASGGHSSQSGAHSHKSSAHSHKSVRSLSVCVRRGAPTTTSLTSLDLQWLASKSDTIMSSRMASARANMHEDGDGDGSASMHHQRYVTVSELYKTQSLASSGSIVAALGASADSDGQCAAAGDAAVDPVVGPSHPAIGPLSPAGGGPLHPAGTPRVHWSVTSNGVQSTSPRTAATAP
ncbi:hypothetical protein FOA52_008253 [Chlamydomonas sp. UWO 241]|nr:hypothetical protein FOA52_008253 [Chlamydomonas sp. UWO 241]